MEKQKAKLILGIDTGGTYTDAVLCEENSDGMKLLCSAKARTTKENLTIGIRNAAAGLDRELLRQVYRVSLSTTLATNACVEGIGGEVKLVLIDKAPLTDTKVYEEYGLPAPEEIVFLKGNINTDGSISMRPSKEELYAALKPVCKPGVCVAISGVFSTRNAELEQEAADVAKELGAKVICGRHVAPGQLNYLRRAATALLNGRLQSVIRDFLESVEKALQELEVNASIDIVRSDGSLMNHEFALEYPVETLLCGPAASVSGVIHLLQAKKDQDAADEKSSCVAKEVYSEQDYVIADIGGTTTDLSLVRGGQAVRTKSGVNIGSYRTSVQSVFVETLGLGGDTRLYLNQQGKLVLDTRRAVPLCVLSAEYPYVKEELRAFAESGYSVKRQAQVYEFLTLARSPQQEELAGLSEEEKEICLLLKEGPQSMRACAAKVGKDLYTFNVDHLESLGLVRRAAMTLTDILHLEGGFVRFDAEASRIAAQYFMNFFEIEEAEFLRRSRELAIYRLYRAIVMMCVRRDRPHLKKEEEAGIERMIETAFYGGDLMNAAFRLPVALVGVGAAAAAFVPDVGKKLATTVLLPDGAPVANAIGAAASSVCASVSREIKRNETDLADEYVVYGGEAPAAFETYEEALQEAKSQAKIAVEKLARDRGILGALQIQVEENRNILETESAYGKLTFDFGGAVTATASAKTSEILSGV